MGNYLSLVKYELLLFPHPCFCNLQEDQEELEHITKTELTKYEKEKQTIQNEITKTVTEVRSLSLTFSFMNIHARLHPLWIIVKIKFHVGANNKEITCRV